MESNSDDECLHTGSHPPYRWLTSPKHFMGAFVELCAEALIGRSLAVTSIDSGLPWLTEQQRLANWDCRSGIVYSPRLTGTAELFFQRDGPDDPGYDEWYLFDGVPPDLGEIVDLDPYTPEFVARSGQLIVFASSAQLLLYSAEPNCELFVRTFWDQLELTQPESYIADGRECLTFVSRNEVVFELVLKRLQVALLAEG